MRSVFKVFKKRANDNSQAKWSMKIEADGIRLGLSSNGQELQHDMLPAVLDQLNDATIGLWTDDSYFIAWDDLFLLQKDSQLAEFYPVFELPKTTELRPSLVSFGSLTDEEFQIAVGNWLDQNGASVHVETSGGLITYQGKTECLTAEQWQLLKSVRAFSKRAASERGDLEQRLSWGKIRKLAVAADANLDAFLFGTVVLTPEKLEIELRKSKEVLNDSVIEVVPSFEDAPANWVERFDQSTRVLDRYDIPTAEGIVQVVIQPKVKTVLNEIKRMPGRLVAGSRAQAFLINPFATLGDDAVDVISEEKFIDACDAAGIRFERFFPHIKHDSQLFEIGLRIEAPSPMVTQLRLLNC